MKLSGLIKTLNCEDTDPEWAIPTLWRCPRCAVMIEQKGDAVECPVCGKVIV